MRAIPVWKSTVFAVSIFLPSNAAKADLVDDISPIVEAVAPVIALGAEMHNIRGGAGLALKALNPVSSVIQMEIESRQPRYRDAPHIVYARGLTDFVVSKPIYAIAGTFASAACASDPASCGLVATSAMNRAQFAIDASKDAVERRLRAFDDYARQAAAREATRRANGERSFDDYPPIRDARRATTHFSEQLLTALDLQETPEYPSDSVECGSMAHYSQIGHSTCGMEDEQPSGAADDLFDGVWHQASTGEKGITLQVAGAEFSLTLGEGMESCGTITGTLSVKTTDEIGGSFHGRCSDLNMQGKVGMQRNENDYTLTSCVSMATGKPDTCSLGYFATAERAKQ